MRYHRRTLVFGTLFVGGLIVIAWLEYYPTSNMFAIMGLPGPRANSHRHCTGIYDYPHFKIFPRRFVNCRGDSYFSPTGSHFESVTLDGLTRRVVEAQKAWAGPDSAEWALRFDSVQRQLALHGGKTFKCKYAPDLPPADTLVYWHFAGFYLRQMGTRSAYVTTPNYTQSLFATVQMPPECLHPIPRRDPEENSCDNAVVKVPLPGGWVACWKEPLLGG